MVEHPYVMVVDDDQDMLRILSRTLELEGFNVDVAANGSSALALMEECRPDLVVLDVMMPELDGFQVLNLIRQRYSIPVIMLTARCEVTSLQKALALGADDYVTKPFNVRILLARVRAKMRRAGSGVQQLEKNP